MFYIVRSVNTTYSIVADDSPTSDASQWLSNNLYIGWLRPKRHA